MACETRKASGVQALIWSLDQIRGLEMSLSALHILSQFKSKVIFGHVRPWDCDWRFTFRGWSTGDSKNRADSALDFNAAFTGVVERLFSSWSPANATWTLANPEIRK